LAERSQPPTPSPRAAGWRRYRREVRFLVLFVVILGGGFTFLAWEPVNDHLVEPFTAGVATASGWSLDLLGQGVSQRGTVLRNDRFAVNIKNGCNGVEAMIIFLGAVLAFPAGWKSRLVGLVLGTLVIQVINLIRVVALFFTGAYFPAFFNSSHTVLWQSIVVLAAFLLFIFWAGRFADPPAGPA
jgi:exosortase H (IPTLxxWG-CTERM-specific)